MTVSHCGQLYDIFPPTLIRIGSSSLSSFLIGDGDGYYTSVGTGDGVPCGGVGHAGGGVDCAGGGVAGGGVVIDLTDLSNWGKSPAPASVTASSNIPHPSAIIRWPAATVLIAGIN